MKRAALIFVSLLCGILNMSAQNSGSSSEVLAFRNAVEQFLKEEGYFPKLDTEDNSLNFKKEGESYWITVEDSSPTYIEIHKSGFGIEDTNLATLKEACNRATRETRCAKVYVSAKSVSISVEVYCHTINDFKPIFDNCLSALDLAKDKVKKYYNEKDE